MQISCLKYRFSKEIYFLALVYQSSSTKLYLMLQYCRKVWLALYDSDNIHNTKDEQLGRDFMVAKYEKKLYYMEPSTSLKNGNSSFPGQSIAGASVENVKVQPPLSNSSPVTSPPRNLKTFQVSFVF